jgi:hypothetical protein
MSKIDNVGFYNKQNGEDISFEVFNSIQKEENRNKLKTIFNLIDDSPEKLSLSDVDKYMTIKGINYTKISKFEEYYISNEILDLELFDKKISMKSFYYFKYLVSKHCSMTYTLQFKNNMNITKDVQVSESLNISVESWRKIKKELIELGLIKIINFEKKKYYKINPCYIGKKKILSPHTYYAFREDLIKYKLLDDIQVVWWDKFFEEEYSIIYKSQINKNTTESIDNIIVD